MRDTRHCACHGGNCCNGNCCNGSDGKCCGKCKDKCSHKGGASNSVNPFPAWNDESTAEKIDVSTSIIGITEHEEEIVPPPDPWFN